MARQTPLRGNYEQTIPLKLELGAGEHPSPGGFVHNDVVDYVHVEIVADCRKLPMIETGSVSILRAIHLLEHFGPCDAEDALREWTRCLCPRGVLEVAMPDLQQLGLMTMLTNITLPALLRDVYALFPAPDWLTPQELRAFARRLARGLDEGAASVPGTASGSWPHVLSLLYAPVWKSDMAQAHRWGYCEESLRRTLQGVGLRRVVVERDGTSLHAWGEKEAA